MCRVQCFLNLLFRYLILPASDQIENCCRYLRGWKFKPAFHSFKNLPAYRKASPLPPTALVSGLSIRTNGLSITSRFFSSIPDTRIRNHESEQNSPVCSFQLPDSQCDGPAFSEFYSIIKQVRHYLPESE